MAEKEEEDHAMVSIASFARIKPTSADKSGGVDSAKGITFSPAEGVVRIKGKGPGSEGKVASHFTATIAPDAAQDEVYDIICAPLVAKWLDGYDADIVSYGQTGSGKTFTMFGPPRAMAEAASALGDGGCGGGGGGGGSGGSGGGGGTVSGEGVMRDEYGFILRTGFEALAAVEAINSGGGRAVLHGSMVEMSIMSFTHQGVLDLLNNSKPCYVDEAHHLQGARHVPLRCTRDLVQMAAAVELRATRYESGGRGGREWLPFRVQSTV